ncbi:MAG: hypothetical protein PHR06_03875 [Candidatus Cloacimonetes bacterium]|nr:hypothetical protein [Candidatus Cloacimonadota bacterium]
MKRIVNITLILLSFLAAISLFSCRKWEYDVERNGIHFEKITQSENGTIVGFMSKNQNIQGFPCEKGWIHFDKDWNLLSFQLHQDFMYKNTLLPAHTWFLFPYYRDITGYGCSFPADYKVQGYLCSGSGGYKGTHTGFYESGNLRSFYPPEDVLINGVPCKASLLVNVNLHENGMIKSCKLARDYQTDGKLYRKGRFLEFDEFGKVK